MRHFQPETSSTRFNMTPMIDVVFQLIIFFLVASHFTNQENAVELELPKTADAQEMEQDETPRMTISIPEEGRFFVGMKPVSETELRQLLQQEKTRWKEAFQLRIRTWRKLPYGEVEPIMLMAAQMGIYDVQFAVLDE